MALIAQVAPHALLVPFYWSASIYPMTDAELVRSPHFATTPNWWVYYIHPDGDRVMRQRVDGSDLEIVARVPPSSDRRDATDTGGHRLTLTAGRSSASRPVAV